MKGCSILLLITFCTLNAIAQAAEIGNKEWRQLTDTMGITYDELATIYDVSTGLLLDESRHVLKNVDFSGWTWATAQDVYAMYSTVIGKTLESYDYYYEENPSWLFPFFNDQFEFTDRPNAVSGVVSGIGRDGAYEHSVIAIKALIGVDDPASNSYFGSVDTRRVSRNGGNIEYEIRYGAHMYRTKPDELRHRTLAVFSE